MGAATLLPFTSTTTLQLRGDRLISQGSQLQRRGISSCRVSLRTLCSSNPASTTVVGNAAEVRNRDSSSAKREQQLLSSQCSEDTHLQSRLPCRAVKAAATTTEAMTTECKWDVYCDILPDSCDCQTHLHLTSSWQTCETTTEKEASEKLMVLGPKKQLRLSFVSWDLLD